VSKSAKSTRLLPLVRPQRSSKLTLNAPTALSTSLIPSSCPRHNRVSHRIFLGVEIYFFCAYYPNKNVSFARLRLRLLGDTSLSRGALLQPQNTLKIALKRVSWSKLSVDHSYRCAELNLHFFLITRLQRAVNRCNSYGVYLNATSNFWSSAE
jgi:hypothetical protein